LTATSRIPLIVSILAGVAFLALVASVAVLSLLLPPMWRPDYPELTPPLPYYTAVEAFKVASPQLDFWSSDAIIVAIHTGPSPEPRLPAIREDGRATSWTLMVASPSAGNVAYITLVDDVTYVSGHDGNPDEPLRFEPISLPVDEMLDSDDVLSIALAEGSPCLPMSIGTRLPYTDSDRRLHPLSWVLGFGERGTEGQIVIDAVTGEILQNDFSRAVTKCGLTTR